MGLLKRDSIATPAFFFFYTYDIQALNICTIYLFMFPSITWNPVLKSLFLFNAVYYYTCDWIYDISSNYQ